MGYKLLTGKVINQTKSISLMYMHTRQNCLIKFVIYNLLPLPLGSENWL